MKIERKMSSFGNWNGDGNSYTKMRGNNNKQDAQLSQRDRAAGCVIVFAESRRLELGDNILRTL